VILLSFNPFEERPVNIEATIQNWKELYPESYNKYEVDPYTKLRIILTNGAEFEANWFSHQFHRHCCDNDLRRELALTRYIEKQQQMKIANLKPINETILETTIGYEQLAVDLTARLALQEPNEYVKAALDFALLEDFDHLYRYSNLLELEWKIPAEKLVGGYTEIMPARPTIAHHRHPFDNVTYFVDYKSADIITKLNIGIITAAEQQTMNYYMNVTGFYTSDLGRKLYQEIGLVEEEHVTHYGGLMDPSSTWLESLLLHEYTECYLYYSCYKDETDAYIRNIWEQNLIQEIAHLHKAADLLQKYEGKDWQQVIPNGQFPKLLKLGPNINYVRDVIKATVEMTADREGYINVNDLPNDADFFMFQDIVNPDKCIVPSHCVIDKYIKSNGIDYRYEVAPNPIESLRNRKVDNTTLGRVKQR
jgi:hypothetical protein